MAVILNYPMTWGKERRLAARQHAAPQTIPARTMLCQCDQCLIDQRRAPEAFERMRAWLRDETNFN